MAMALGEYLGMSEVLYHVALELDLDLPVGHGFGMSGAMTFAALMAVEGELGLLGGDVDRLLAFAHAAEVAFSTGLGDVVAQARGGIDVRVRPGLPPHGEVTRSTQDSEVLLAWSGTPLHTRSILSDPEARRALEKACVPHLAVRNGEADLDWLLTAGWDFSQEAGLVSDEVKRMVDICSTHGRASQVMLGNSVFAVGDLDLMGQDLGVEGFDWAVASVDNQGVRLLD
jgi:pantoate kinase